MKKEVRKKMLELRNKIPQDLKTRKDEKIALKFIEFLKERHIKSVLLYASFGSEVDTWRIFEYCKKLSIKTAFPKVKEKILEIYWVKERSELTKGYKSILEPCNAQKAQLEDVEVIAVPGLAFDKNCFRIGYGGGFYDKLLCRKKGIAAGLAYEEQIIDKLPVELHDVKVDLIITDERVINCV
ncbi:5-formyltetrahydrofolate cyclo-ligase [Thermodesulfovibrio sp. 3907-1M]|uniref:5-formyltetrahydrofolate cyclo-ligase n=1 Tax=Thermodesulfovibrio autotrophicus TaxID=3118333 RepID=A0AAU8GXJ0_9BACT